MGIIVFIVAIGIFISLFNSHTSEDDIDRTVPQDIDD